MIAAMMDVTLSTEIVSELNAIQFMEFVSGRVVALYMISVLEIIVLLFIMLATGSTVNLGMVFAMEISVKVGLPVMARDVQQLKEIVME